MTTNSLLDALRQHRLLDFKQLEELNALPFSDPKALAKELIRRDWLTPYQANQLLTGKGHELVLGSYILLERLGEGGMGQVFKARHRNLGRIAAIKLIRKERLDNPSAVKRFQREVRSAAALSHPNIVLAYDADEIAGTHLMVMEYIEGAIDLAKLVKKNGPLPVERACEYIRQAALGLQHAYERGMVHRDIKPANLLLTDGGRTVKVLDMGLARLDDPTEDDGDKSSTMTQEGAVMGTPDYIAPEQALESHTVDIRADLYSLGCAFYYLLTGRVPFPGGTLIQKINKHQFEEPLPVEKLRPEVPPEVATVVRKLMAKKPMDRYQTPAEAAAALAVLSSQRSGFAVAAVANALTIADAEQAKAGKEAERDTLSAAFSYMEKRDDTVAFEKPPSVKTRANHRRWLLVGAVGGPLALICLAFIVFLVVYGLAGKNSPVKEVERFVAPIPPPKKILPKVDDAWLKLVAAMPAEKQVEAVTMKLKEMNPDFDGKVTHRIDKDGAVTVLAFRTDNVTDLSPVRALTALRVLSCGGSYGGKRRLADLSPLNNMNLTTLDCSYSRVFDLSPLKGMKLAVLHCRDTKVSDLSPLKDMMLTELNCPDTTVSDLSPLKDMKLTSLECWQSQVSDLSPLKDMKLTFLDCRSTPVSDLSPLKDMTLILVKCAHTPVADLSPLKGMKLTTLNCFGSKVSDLSPLKGMPLKDIWCDFKPFRDTEFLRSFKTLEKINDKDAKLFWKEVDAQQAAFDAWVKQVAAMKAEQQVEAVKAELMKRNPGYDGKVKEKIEGAVVTELTVITDNVTDISPVRALTGLRSLTCSGNWPRKGQLADLSPLTDMKLTFLNCKDTQVFDLSPLKGMPLERLLCASTKVADLSPLKGMPLTYLDCGNTPVGDLLPLKGLPLRSLWCSGTSVTDLSPLKGMPLTFLSCPNTKIADLSPLAEMSLTHLWCYGTGVTDVSPLERMKLEEIRFTPKNITKGREIFRQMKSLKTIGIGWEAMNMWPADEFWKKFDAGEFNK